MDIFLAYSDRQSGEVSAISRAISRTRARVFTSDNIPVDSSEESRAILAVRAAAAIVVVWPRDDAWTPLLRQAVRIGEENGNLIVVAQRGTDFEKIYAYRISYFDDAPAYRQMTQSLSKLLGRPMRGGNVFGIEAYINSARILRPGWSDSRRLLGVASLQDIAQLDLSIIEGSDDTALKNRADELHHFMYRTERRSRELGKSGRDRADIILFDRYLHEYGHVTPWVMIAISNRTTEAQLLAHLIDLYPAQLLSGRFVAFVVEGDKREPMRKPPQHRLLRENVYLARVNGSPVQNELFEELTTYTSRRATRTFSEWMSEFKASQQAPQSEYEAYSDLASKVADQPFHFVSYSRANSTEVTALVDALESIGVKCWFDTRSILGGEVFVQSITTGLKRCVGVLPFCSLPFSRSKYCLREIMFADQLDKPFRPTWLTDPALEDQMQFLLGPYQAVNGSQDPPAVIAEKLRQSIN